jgi:hypothetical protein
MAAVGTHLDEIRVVATEEFAWPECGGLEPGEA